MLTDTLCERELYKELFPLVDSLGYTVVDIQDSVIRRERHVHLVIKNREGNTSLEDCSAVSRLVYPRLSVIFDSRDIHFEVSSPGLQRNMKDVREFSIFLGERIKVLIGDNWYEGNLRDFDGSRIELAEEQGVQHYPVHTIKKAKLVSNLKEK